MIRNFFIIAWRNISKNKIYSVINISGLAIGMAVATLIALWIYNELTYDKYHRNYDRIVQVMQHQNFNGVISTQVANPAAMGPEIRARYGSDFKYVLQASWNYEHTLTYGDKMFLEPGSFFEPEVTDMLGLKMIYGSKDGLKEMNSILLSQSVAEAYFGKTNPVGKILKVDDKSDLQVTGVYEDIPYNSRFRELKMIMPWSLYLSLNTWIKEMKNPWGSNFTMTYAQLAANADLQLVSNKIKNVKLDNIKESDRKYNPIVFLHPMRKWHLYGDFKNGVNTGGAIDNVWLFGIIGFFVLLLACINFMNLSTARSEKRAREVGIRKTIGSGRRQLIAQFFSEAILISFVAFIFSVFIVLLLLPTFNEVADKKMNLLWNEPWFWISAVSICIFTGLLAGAYPAVFLSSFKPVKVLKGTFRVGKGAALPRKILVVMQFSISIILIIGTIIVYKQIIHAEDRAIGYSKQGLVSVDASEPIYEHYETVRNTLKQSGAIVEMTQSTSPATDVWNTNGGFEWEGKDPNLAVDFPNNGVSHEYGKTLGWTIKSGRDFSKDLASDSAAFIINESAASFLGFTDPVGKTLTWNQRPMQIIGVVEDMLVQSPYKPVRPSLFHISDHSENVFILRLNPSAGAKESLAKIEATFRKFNPAKPFAVKFVDEEFARKFDNEQRVGKLASFFAILAVLISCLGLFGLASFVAEQRIKEIGIRKVLGATVAGVWTLLSKEFIWLVLIACIIATPLAWYFMHNWLQNYDYRTEIPSWVFIISCSGALIITLVTVSFQAIKAAIANPVKSLRTE